MQVIIAALILVGIAVILLGINILFKKKGKFPNFHIGGNKAMKERGIYCATTTHKLEQKSRGRFDIKKLQSEIDDSMSC